MRELTTDLRGVRAACVDVFAVRARFADMWQDADAELQPRVRRARERAAALLADRG